MRKLTSATTSPTTEKPKKPHKDYPLTAHNNGRWCKKVRGKLHYFGRWDDPDGALDEWLKAKDDLLAGRQPRATTGGLTMKGLADRFLTAKLERLRNGELSPRTFAELKQTTDRLIAAFGKGRLVVDLAGDDFAALRKSISKGRGKSAISLANEIQRCKGVFKFAYDEGLIEQPMRYGQSFAKPSRKVIRAADNERGPMMFGAADLRKIIAGCGVPLKAMVLLAVNCGFGNSDCSTLPLSAIDLEGGWIDYPRPKTGIKRRCKLWSETIEALRAAIDKRPAPKAPEHAGQAFVTKYGGSWQKAPKIEIKDKGKNVVAKAVDDPVAKEFAKILSALKLRRRGLGFYSLRRTFATVASGSKDQVAVDFCMGHADESMSARYRQGIDDQRLVDVAEFVRGWLQLDNEKTDS